MRACLFMPITLSLVAHSRDVFPRVQKADNPTT